MEVNNNSRSTNSVSSSLMVRQSLSTADSTCSNKIITDLSFRRSMNSSILSIVHGCTAVCVGVDPTAVLMTCGTLGLEQTEDVTIGPICMFSSVVRHQSSSTSLFMGDSYLCLGQIMVDVDGFTHTCAV